MIPKKEILLVGGSEQELYSYKRVMDMFGLAGHIHLEMSPASAIYFLQHKEPAPDSVIAVLDQEDKTGFNFVKRYEKLHWQKRKKSPLMLICDKDCGDYEDLKCYPQFRKPLSVPELQEKQEAIKINWDFRNWDKEFLQ
ncbi:MAG TPA: hypothetical protein VI112_06445 [Bacteroidia bacterium]|jgi:hypothetical protein